MTSRPDLTSIAARSLSRPARVLAALAVATAASALTPTEAHADFRVCNSTSELVGVAIGYRSESGWITEGWWRVEASACKTLITGALSSRYYYLYAEDAARGGRWEGPVRMCVAETEFKIVGVEDCFKRGYLRAGFREYDTGNQASWMVQLTDDPAPSAPSLTGNGTQ